MTLNESDLPITSANVAIESSAQPHTPESKVSTSQSDHVDDARSGALSGNNLDDPNPAMNGDFAISSPPMLLRRNSPSTNAIKPSFTPRRVQWASGTSSAPANVMFAAAASSPGETVNITALNAQTAASVATRLGDAPSALSLDEMGLDPRAFATLRAALERHNLSSDDLTSIPRNRQRSGTGTATPSAPGTPHSLYTESSNHGSEDDDLPPSHASPPTSHPTLAAAFSSSTHEAGTMVSSTAADSIAPETYENPPDAAGYIMPGETDGLPAPTNVAPSYERQAGRLVAQHRNGLRSWFRRTGRSEKALSSSKTTATGIRHGDIEKRGGSSIGNGDGNGFSGTFSRPENPTPSAPGYSANLSRSKRAGRHSGNNYSGAFTADERDTVNGVVHQRAMRGTGGVLSSLLALYNGQQDDASDTNTSASLSRATTPSSSILDLRLGKRNHLSDHGSKVPRRNEKKKTFSKVKKNIFHLGEMQEQNNPTGTDIHIRPESPSRAHDTTQSSSRSETPTGSRNQDQIDREMPANAKLSSRHRTSTAGSSLDGISKALKPAVNAVSDNIGYVRPSAARSGAGVFGGLIASTGNIMGAATPVAASIGPTVKRAGYHLSRYSLDESKTAPQTRSPNPSHSRTSSTLPMDRMGDGSNTVTPDHLGSSPSMPAVRPKNKPGPLHLGSLGGLEASKRASSWGDLLHMPQMPSLHTPSLPWGSSKPGTPGESDTGGEWPEKGYATTPGREKKSAHRRKKEKRRREEIYITMHVAEILQRQEFIMKLARALMMFGAPSHRLEAQIQATAKVLELQVSCIYLPNVMLLSFGDSATHTSETKFLKQGANLDLGKLLDAHMLYWRVTHDEIGVTEASAVLDDLMRSKSVYRGWQTIIIGGFCSAFITPVSFSGSFIDACIAFPLGCLLVFIQNLASKNELYGNVFEITVATVSSFLAAALASTHRFCYSAVASGSVVLILPGYIVLSGSLELASRSIISGAVRMGYSVIYSLFLGFGLAIGGEIYHQITGQTVYNSDDFQCGRTHDPNGPWYQQTASVWWAFLCVPMYSLFLSLRNQAPLRKELPITIIISCSGWIVNHFASKRFVNRADITSALGSLVVGLLGNLYGRFYYGNAFVVMITGILFQLPSGLSNGGLLAFAAQSNSGSSDSYATGFQTAEQLVQVAIGLTVGLFIASVIVHPFQNKRRGAGLFSL